MKTLHKKILVLILIALAPICLMAESSKIVKKETNLAGFSVINISGGWDAVLTQGEEFAVTIEANKESMDNLYIEVINETLYVCNDTKSVHTSILNSYSNISKVHITMPKLEGITASGGSVIIPKTQFNTENIKIAMSDGSNLKTLLLDCQSLDCRMSGGSDAYIHLVNSENVNIASSSGSNVSLSGLSATVLNLNVSGDSDVKLGGTLTTLMFAVVK